jgi:hypothetical protein
MITLKQGVPPLTAQRLMQTFQAGSPCNSRAPVEAIMARYGVEFENAEDWFFVLDAICQQAARAQADVMPGEITVSPPCAPWHEQPSWRDELAKEAMTKVLDSVSCGLDADPAEIAKQSYALADAMEAASGRGGDTGLDTRGDLV